MRAPLLLLLLLGLPLGLLAQDSKTETEAEIWGGLLYAAPPAATAAAAAKAQDPEKKAATSTGLSKEEFADLKVRLGKVFKDREFHLLGEHTQGLFKQYESWLVPSKELFLKLDSKGPAEGGGVSLNLQLWQEKRVIMKTDATLRPGSPLFIEGPKWREGHLIFVVLLPEKD